MPGTEQQKPGLLDLHIFKRLPGNFLLLSPKLNIVEMSEGYLHLTGKSRVVLTGSYLFDVFPENAEWSPSQNGGIAVSLEKVLKTGDADELPVIRFDTLSDTGELQERYWKTTHQPIKDQNGQLEFIIHQTSDVTSEVLKDHQVQQMLAAEKKASAAARLQANQMEQLFHDIPAQIAIVSGPDLVYDYVNPQYQRELFPGREVLGLPLLTALPEVEGQPILEILKAVYNSGQPHIQNEMLIPLAPYPGAALKDHYFNLVYQPLFTENGEVYAILSFKYEITTHVIARKRLEDTGSELANANQKLDASLISLHALNEELQSSAEELIATNKQLLSAQNDLSNLNLALETRIADRTLELENSFEEQQVLNEEISAANEEMTAANEELTVTNEELSETQRLLQQTLNGLSESEQRFRNLIKDTAVGIILLTGQELKVSIVNDAYAVLIGRSVADLNNQLLFDVIPEAEPIFRPIIDRVRESGEPLYLYDQPYMIYRDDQTIEGFLNLVYQPFREANGIITGVIVLCQDVSIQVKARREMEKSEARFRFLLNAIPQQVWTATPDGALNYVNQVVALDFGHTTESVVGHGWKEFVHPDDLTLALEKWIRSLNSGREYLTEFRLKFADGNYYWHLARAVPLVEDGKAVLWVGTNTNIHDRKNKEYKKDEFLSIASHELKTPLTTIKAFFQLAKKDAAEHKVLNQFVGKAERQLERLGRLIEDLLDVSKINAGKMIYNMDDFDFGIALIDTVESIQQTSARHKLKIASNCGIIYHGDKHRIEQVLINLLNNAIKYSPDGEEVIVTCTVEKKNLIVSVKDFGIGIPEEHLKGLFDRFYRVDNSSARFQGLGLGLFISAEIVKRHGGSFWIESTPGEGSTFYFLLPVNGKQEFADIAGDGQSFYEGDFITVRYMPENFYLDVNWIGYQNYDSVVKGCGIILDLMQKNNCSRVLNDNTEVKGNWSEASDWGAEVWFPDMARAGLQKFAWIYSPSAFSRIAAKISLPNAYDPVAFFDDKESARQWLITNV
ncbi:PAS domain-containing protein [Mucilaginibacter glaciei]|uniref:histidine kinase n=1 Tax=Mucilaginibacter glaciei TaxID=2772109 RepID=A0A926NV10_9SPHI|nr:PAS domain-containing protein [Mucilaginibacter glaciei]MBD1395522.1 PAS domain-containing protein [Mucilaginibacter glaciei]